VNSSISEIGDVARKTNIEELGDKVNEHLVIKKVDVNDFEFINPQ